VNSVTVRLKAAPFQNPPRVSMLSAARRTAKPSFRAVEASLPPVQRWKTGRPYAPRPASLRTTVASTPSPAEPGTRTTAARTATARTATARTTAARTTVEERPFRAA
jgi:hypothetical protein